MHNIKIEQIKQKFESSLRTTLVLLFLMLLLSIFFFYIEILLILNLI
jgi:hypothetical protein